MRLRIPILITALVVFLVLITIICWRAVQKEKPTGNDVVAQKTDKGAEGQYEDSKGIASEKRITITGRLRLVGSSRFARLVITTEDNVDYYIKFRSKEEKERYFPYQTRVVEATGVLKVLERFTPNKKYRVIRNYLTIEEFKVIK